MELSLCEKVAVGGARLPGSKLGVDFVEKLKHLRKSSVKRGLLLGRTMKLATIVFYCLYFRRLQLTKHGFGTDHHVGHVLMGEMVVRSLFRGYLRSC